MWLPDLIRFASAKERRIAVVSGSSRVQFPAYWNHKIYCDRHGLDYFFNFAPERISQFLFMHKIRTVKRHLHLADWLFWLDDDAYFMQPNINLQSKLLPHINRSTFLVICRSPINEGRWTSISSGQFFIRNCELARRFLDAVEATKLEDARAWWDEERDGLFTNGDQDLLWFNIQTRPEIGRGVKIVDYSEFNARPFHIKKSPSEYFLLHFTHRNDMSKRQQMEIFARQHNLAACLSAPEDVSAYALYAEHLASMTSNS